MTNTAKLVKDLAEAHGVTPYNDRASFLATQFNRISGIEGDDTLKLIADLMRAEIIPSNEAADLVLAHVRELAAVGVTLGGAGNELRDEPWLPEQDGVVLKRGE